MFIIYILFGLAWVGNSPGYVYNLCFAVGAPRRFFFWPKTAFPKILDTVIFQKSEFSSKNSILGHLFGEMSHKSSSYGPYGPFRFSVKSEFGFVIFHQILDFGGKPTFQDFYITELILLG